MGCFGLCVGQVRQLLIARVAPGVRNLHDHRRLLRCQRRRQGDFCASAGAGIRSCLTLTTRVRLGYVPPGRHPESCTLAAAAAPVHAAGRRRSWAMRCVAAAARPARGRVRRRWAVSVVYIWGVFVPWGYVGYMSPEWAAGAGDGGGGQALWKIGSAPDPCPPSRLAASRARSGAGRVPDMCWRWHGAFL